MNDWKRISETPATDEFLSRTILAGAKTDAERDRQEFRFWAFCVGRWLLPNATDGWWVRVPYHVGPGSTGKTFLFERILAPLHGREELAAVTQDEALGDPFFLDRLLHEGRTRAWLCDGISRNRFPWPLLQPLLGESMFVDRQAEDGYIADPKEFPVGQFAGNVDPHNFGSAARRLLVFEYNEPLSPDVAARLAREVATETEAVRRKGLAAHEEFVRRAIDDATE